MDRGDAGRRPARVAKCHARGSTSAPIFTGMAHDRDDTRAQVLIVDDDESMCDLLGAELESRGFAPSSVSEPERALESLGSRAVDVVVTDLQMRGMNGLELCERIVTAHPELPVVLLTAHGTLESAVAALRLRAYDFLCKQPDIDALVAAFEDVWQLLQLRRSR